MRVGPPLVTEGEPAMLEPGLAMALSCGSSWTCGGYGVSSSLSRGAAPEEETGTALNTGESSAIEINPA